MTVSTEIATPHKQTPFKSTNPNFSAQTQIKPKSEIEFLPRDTEKSEFLDLVDVGDVAFSMVSVRIHGMQRDR